MTIATIPNIYYEYAFNANPNQGAVPPYWQDLSPRVLFAWDAHPGGRHYELDVNETGTWNHRLANPDGALDPSNASSAFAPNVKLFRQCRIRVPLASTQNLLPQIIATGLSTMDPTSDSAGNWFYSAVGSVAQAANLAAAPSGQTTAVAWTSPVGTTNGSPLYAGVVNAAAPSATGPVADCVQVTAALQYTLSAYFMRVASADATVQVQISLRWYDINGNTLSTSASASTTVPTVGSWARATVTGTAPAGAVWARPRFFIQTPATTTAANTIYATGWQLEQAAAATSWADPGLTQFIFTGMDERLPQTWTEQNGTYGTSEPIGIDAMGALAVFTLKDPFVNEVLALNPNIFYTLSDPQGSSACSDISGKRVAAPIENSPYGVGSLTLGSSITATTTPSGLFLGTAGPVATFNNNPSETGSLQFAETFVSLHKTTVTPGPPVSGNWTRIIHFRSAAAPGASAAYILWNAIPPSYGAGSNAEIQFQLQGTGGPTGAVFMVVAGATGGTPSYSGATNLCDGNWHQLAISCDGSGNVAFYVDGAQVGTGSITLPTSGIAVDVIGASVQLGTNLYKGGFVGDAACAIELPFAATVAQMTNLYNSWRTASSGDSSGARYQRVLTWIGWTGPTKIDTGQTASMGPATDNTGSTALDALNNIALTENGDSYASSAGIITFKARSARYNKRTPLYTFGEGAPVGTAGEWPCEIAAIEYDSSHLAGIVQVTQYQGPLFTAASAPSQLSYFPRTYQRTVNVTNPAEAQDAANYLLSQLKDPHLRPDTIRLHPSAVPGLFAVCVSLSKGTRIRLIKRPNGAPAVTVDAFVEKRDWSWDPDTGDVYLDVQASPADLTNYWQIGALHTTLNLQAASGQAKATINALSDAAVNTLAQSLPWAYSLTFEPGTARQETLAIAPGGIPTTTLGYTSAQLTFTTNFAFTHNAGTVVCEPLPAGYTDPTTWDASCVIGAASSAVLSGGASGQALITVGPLQDAATNALGQTWNTGDTIWLGPGTGNFESATILSVPTTVPGYTSCQLTLTANLAHSHNPGELVCDPLPAGVTNPAAVLATARLAY